MRLTENAFEQVSHMRLTVDTYVLNNRVRLITRVYSNQSILVKMFTSEIQSGYSTEIQLLLSFIQHCSSLI